MGRGRNGILRKPKGIIPGNQPVHWGSRPGVFCPPERKNVITPQDVEIAQSLAKEQLAYILFKGGNTVSGGTTINSSRTKPRLGSSNR